MNSNIFNAKEKTAHFLYTNAKIHTQEPSRQKSLPGRKLFCEPPKMGVLLWCERWDSNPHGVTTRTSNVLVYHSNTLASAIVLYDFNQVLSRLFSVFIPQLTVLLLPRFYR